MQNHKTAMNRLLLANPYLRGSGIETSGDCQEALEAAAASLNLLGDLFTAKVEHHAIMDSDEARHGMFLQLSSLAELLRLVGDRLHTMP